MGRYIQVTSGRGPVECCRVVVLVMKKLVADANAKGLKAEVVDREECACDGCLYSVVLSLEGENVDSFAAEWEGSVQWVSTQNPFRPHHERKNWFVGVHAFDLRQPAHVKDSDIVYETTRSSKKAGGQHLNTTDSAVKAIHLPTGVSAMGEDERNQHKNRRLAHDRLLLKLMEMEDEKKAEQDRVIWMNHNLLKRGNPVKRFKGEL
ncbi:MAG: peptide chain release factor H [Paludibacteraceae bacterium]|nr:peptide chain release factor H [Paludibacteraceae bacterium]